MSHLMPLLCTFLEHNFTSLTLYKYVKIIKTVIIEVKNNKLFIVFSDIVALLNIYAPSIIAVAS